MPTAGVLYFLNEVEADEEASVSLPNGSSLAEGANHTSSSFSGPSNGPGEVIEREGDEGMREVVGRVIVAPGATRDDRFRKRVG
jgi:hypothetical protein